MPPPPLAPLVVLLSPLLLQLSIILEASHPAVLAGGGSNSDSNGNAAAGILPDSSPPALGFVILAHSSSTAQTAAALVAALAVPSPRRRHQRSFVVHMDRKCRDGCSIFFERLKQLMERRGLEGEKDNVQCVSVVDAQLWEWSLVEASLAGFLTLHQLRSQAEPDSRWDVAVTLSAEAYPLVSNAELDAIAAQMDKCCVVTLEGAPPRPLSAMGRNGLKAYLYRKAEPYMPSDLWFGSQWGVLSAEFVAFVSAATKMAVSQFQSAQYLHRSSFLSALGPIVEADKDTLEEEVNAQDPRDMKLALDWFAFWGEADLVRSRMKSCKSFPRQNCNSVEFNNETLLLQRAQVEFTGRVLKHLKLDVINKLKKNDRRGFAPGGDETFFSTLLMESSFKTTLCGFTDVHSLKQKDKGRPLPKKLCFEKWGSGGHSHPSELTKSDLEELRSSSAVFARKVKYTVEGAALRRLVDTALRNASMEGRGA